MDPRVMQPTQPAFDPAKVQRAYTESQWQEKEDWYILKIQNINIPIAPTSSDLQNVACMIEGVLSTARLDMSFIEQNYNKYQLLVKIQESVLYTGLGSIQGMKLTVAERESYVKSHINTTPWDNGTLTLYQLREKSDARYTFMKSVIAALSDKKDLLITHSSAIKTEASINSFTPSVPNNNMHVKG